MHDRIPVRVSGSYLSRWMEEGGAIEEDLFLSYRWDPTHWINQSDDVNELSPGSARIYKGLVNQNLLRNFSENTVVN